MKLLLPTSGRNIESNQSAHSVANTVNTGCTTLSICQLVWPSSDHFLSRVLFQTNTKDKATLDSKFGYRSALSVYLLKLRCLDRTTSLSLAPSIHMIVWTFGESIQGYRRGDTPNRKSRLQMVLQFRQSGSYCVLGHIEWVAGGLVLPS